MLELELELLRQEKRTIFVSSNILFCLQLETLNLVVKQGIIIIIQALKVHFIFQTVILVYFS